MNKEIRTALRTNDIKQWQLAEAIGISEFTLCRRLRKELDEQEKKQMMEKINSICAEREQEGN